MFELLKKVLWFIAIIFLFGGAIYYSISLKFPQLRLVSIFKKFLNSNPGGISAFESLSISLAARIGVGSLSGIALAIYLGGPGTIFWIWIIGLLTAVNVFCETYLGVKYNERDGDLYKGGPAFYLDKALGDRKLAKIYALLVIVAYIFGFITIQSNTIAISVSNVLNIDVLTVAIILVLVVALSIIRGLKEIATISSKIIPIMGIGYILLSIFIFILNFEKIPYVVYNIFKNAWGFKSMGIGFLSIFIIGMQRGIFCTEAGLGTGSIATSSSNPKNKVDFSLGQLIGIYFTVFVVCTATALIILTSDYNTSGVLVGNGIELTQYALEYHLGSIGKVVLMILVIFLAYSTIIAGYYYGESNLKYLIKKVKKGQIFVLKIITLILLLLGSIIRSRYLWDAVDIFIALLAIINMYALLSKNREIILEYNRNIRK